MMMMCIIFLLMNNIYSDLVFDESFELAIVDTKWRMIINENENIPAQFTKYASF